MNTCLSLVLWITFLSTLSLRRATVVIPGPTVMIPDFYPRSPCGERPLPGAPRFGRFEHFYPRSPCGERPCTRKPISRALQFLSTLSLRRATLTSVVSSVGTIGFLSTLSLRRATGIPVVFLGDDSISIHALLAESDLKPPIQTHR